MHFLRSATSLFVVLLFSVSLPAQQASTPVSQPPQRDPQAVTHMAQMIAATGWTSAAIPTTITASGTLTRDQQLPQPFALKQRGPSQHRFALQQSNGTATTVVHGLTGTIVSSDSIKRRLPAHAAMSLQSPAFPFLSDLTRIADPNVEVRDLGTATINGIACHGTYIARHANSSDRMAPFRDLAAPLKVWTSVQSSLPVRIDFVRLADDNPYVKMDFSRSYSNYRAVNGVAVAFQQEEYLENQLMYRFAFTDVQFGAVLTDADFDPAAL